MIPDLTDNNLYNQIARLLETARQNLVRTVNQTMVYTYYEIGRMIVEDEQQGKERAEYGKHILKELSVKLSEEFGKGFSVENLDRMRFFYKTYSSSISSTPLTKLQTSDNQTIQHSESANLSAIDNSINVISEISLRKFNLSWSHTLKLMRIENTKERSFYELESAANNWSLKELQRQFDTGLYERLALSRNKEGINQLSSKGQIIKKPKEITT